MRYSPAEMPDRDAYRLQIATVIPRPIALISTITPDGHPNVAPFSYYNAVSSTPFLLMVSIARRDGQKKDTWRNIESTGELVICLPTREMAEKVNLTSGEWLPEYNEFEVAGLTSVPSEVVRPPRVGESPVAFECRLERLIEIGEPSRALILARAVSIWVDDAILGERGPDPHKLDPLLRLGGISFAALGENFEIKRPVGHVPPNAEKE